MIIQRYIFKELLITFLLIFSAITGVAFVGSSYQLFKTFEGLGIKFAMLVAPTILALMLPYTIIASFTAAATLVYGRLSADNEIMAIKMSGVHINRVLYPAITLCIMLCIVCYLLNMYICPEARYNRRILARKSISEILKSPPAGKTNIKLSDYAFEYSFFQEGVFNAPFISCLEEGKLKNIYNAKEGLLTIEEDGPPVIVLKDCHTTGYENGKTTEAHAEQFPLELNIEDVYKPKTTNDMSIGELLNLISSEISSTGEKESATRIINFRLARTFAPLALLLIAMPVGIFVRKGSKLAGLGASLPPLLLYFILSQALEGLGSEGKVSPYIAAHLPIAVLFIIAIPLLIWLYKR